jgi:hypothetical protein
MKWIVLAALLCIPATAMAETSPEKCKGHLSAAFAQEFATGWIAAWNSHDLNRILELYSDDFEMHSPSIIAVAGEPSGVLKGKANVAAYWAKALKGAPDLKFDLINVFAGIQSVSVHYTRHGGREVIEVMEFNAACKVVRGSANWKI